MECIQKKRRSKRIVNSGLSEGKKMGSKDSECGRES